MSIEATYPGADYCARQLILAMEGGYSPDDQALAALDFIRGLGGSPEVFERCGDSVAKMLYLAALLVRAGA